MDSRLGFVLLALVVVGCACAYAETTSLVTLDINVRPAIYRTITRSQASEATPRNGEICTLCEEFAAEAIYYLSENETQAEIINTLHLGCSKLHSFKHQCIYLVDYYAPLVFLEIASLQPELFCEKVSLCGTKFPRLPPRESICTLCQDIVVETLGKLKDPDIQLEIIELLLKGCSAVENFVPQCKKIVFHYGPLIFAELEKFLEETDICTAIHVCKATYSEAAAIASD